MGITIFERWSPEYALYNAFNDIQKLGLEGLKKHLTSNALKTVNMFEEITKEPGVSILTDAISMIGGNAVSVFLDKLSECEWSIKDVMKGSETSKVIVGFNYEDKMVGTVPLTMIKEDKIWKIDKLNMPKFEKFALPQGNGDQPAEA